MDSEGPETLRTFVQESQELLELVKQVVVVPAISTDPKDGEFHVKCKHITDIVSNYQEQSYLLDPILSSLVTPLMGYLRNHRETHSPTNAYSRTAHIYKLVYVLTKVRGFKIVVRFFPHEITDLDPTLEYLKAQNPKDYETWEVRYILLLWLSILGRIPFAFSTMDRGGMVTSIMEQAKERLADSGKTREAAAELLSRVITRPDLVEHYLGPYMDWCLATLHEPAVNPNPHLKLGILTSLANIFKLGKRQELLGKAGGILLALENEGDTSIIWRKLKIKLAQRVGLVLLKPLSQNWRYQKATKTLLQSDTLAAFLQEKEGDDEEVLDIPADIEDIIDKLLIGLKDKDTVVRWSSAKGIGRIASRLPKAFADDIVEHVLSLFNPLIEMADSAWHGGCLGLAELARRGLLLPSRLDSTFTKIFDALQYDTPLGTYSVGSHVRDAACYVCWAFARAYSSNVLHPYVLQLSNALISVALFDREINCRRAASAAYQENVGRVGNFPHGIDIIGIADYFAVGARSEAYTTICAQIAQYEEYKYELVDHLVKHRIGHWDSAVRELASKSLHAICKSTDVYAYMTDKIIPALLLLVTHEDTAKRHGSILAIAELILALHEQGKTLTPSILAQIREILPSLEAARLFRGKGGEQVRAAVCRLIECTSIIAIPLNLKPNNIISEHLPIAKNTTNFQSYIELYQQALDENITYSNPTIQAAAVAALRKFSRQYYQPQDTIPTIVMKYIRAIDTDLNADVRRGYCMAIGSLPLHVLEHGLHQALETLIAATQQEQAVLKDAETRQLAVLALAEISETLGLSLPPEKAVMVLQALSKSTEDYTTDHRGDVGSWVRLAAIDAIECYVKLWGSKNTVFTEDTSTIITGLLIQQSLEKMDKVRIHAIKVLGFVLMHEHLPIRQKQSLFRLFPSDLDLTNLATYGWDASANFSILAPCLDMDDYRYHAVLGFISSVGGMGKNVADASTKWLVDHVQKASTTQRVQFLTAVIAIVEVHSKSDRIILPALKTLTTLCSVLWGDDSAANTGEQLKKLISLFGTQVRGSKEVPKLSAFLELAGNILMCASISPATSQSLMAILLVLLSHRYPLIRKNTAACIFKYVLLQEETPAMRDIRNILQTDWTQPTQQLTNSIQTIYSLLDIPMPKKIVAKKAAPNPTTIQNATPSPQPPTSSVVTLPATSSYATQKTPQPFDASDEL